MVQRVKKYQPREKAQVGSGLGPFGCPEPSCWENSTAGRRRSLVEVLKGLEKRDCHFSDGKASSASRQIFWDVWIPSFPSVDLKVAVSWRKNKKAMSMNEWQLAGLSTARHDQVPPLLLKVHLASPTSSRCGAAASWVVAWKCGIVFILCWVFCAFCRCFFTA